jgi:hypothetical protein
MISADRGQQLPARGVDRPRPRQDHRRCAILIAACNRVETITRKNFSADAACLLAPAAERSRRSFSDPSTAAKARVRN